MTTPFTQEELNVLLPAIETAVFSVANPRSKTLAQYDGEIYTNLRRELRYKNVESLIKLMGRRKKHIARYTSSQWELVEGIIQQMKLAHLKADKDKDPLMGLRMALAGMNDAATKMERINQEADKLLDEVAAIHKTLNPDGDGDVQ